MFRNAQAFPGISTNGISAAKIFYKETLGLEVNKEQGMLTLHLAGSNGVLVYPKGNDHIPARFTILNFPVNDIDDVVDDLIWRGVALERYEGMNQDERGTARGKGPPSGGSRIRREPSSPSFKNEEPVAGEQNCRHPWRW